MKIRTKIIVVLGLMTLLVSLVLGMSLFINIRNTRSQGSLMLSSMEQKIEEDVRLQLLELAGNISNFINSVEQEIDKNMLNAANLLYEEDRISNGKLNLNDLERLKALTGMSDLYLTDPNGVFTLSTEKEAIGISLFNIWEGYRWLVTGESSYLPSDIKVKVETGEIFKFTAIPRAGKRGVLQSALDAGTIESHLEDFVISNRSIHSINLFDYTLMTLTSNTMNNETATYTKGQIVKPGTTPIDAFFKGQTAAQLTMNKKEAQIYYPIMDGARVRYVLFIDLSTAEYFELGSQMEGTTADLINQSISSDRFSLVLVFSMLLLFSLVVSVLISRMLRPLSFYNGIVASFSDGDFSRQVPPEYLKLNDEMGEMAKSFGDTHAKMKQLIMTIKDQSTSLQSIGNDLAENMEKTSEAINVIASNIQNIKGKVINQSASVAESTATMEQVTANINKLNDHIEKQSTNMSQASSAIEEMVANIQSVSQTLVKNEVKVKDLREASEVGHTGLQNVATDIQEIAKESAGLLEINAVMKSIASQTNLLSMNAAIEAAHAGEAGRGFAVVADEIRKLSESSSKQSVTIGTVLKKIKGSIDKITASTDNVLNRFNAIDESVKIVAEQEDQLRNAMEEQGAGSKQVLQGVGNMNEINQHVRSGSQEMFEGTKEVIRESKNLETVTQEISTGMNEMAGSAEQILAAVNHINKISVRNKENINLLAQEVSRFKVE